MQENAIYSVISPEGCAAILWRDASQAKKAASAFKPDAAHCLELRVIDGIVPEPEGRGHLDPDAAAVLLREALYHTWTTSRTATSNGSDAYAARSSALWASSAPERPRGPLSTLSTGLSPDRESCS